MWRVWLRIGIKTKLPSLRTRSGKSGDARLDRTRKIGFGLKTNSRTGKYWLQAPPKPELCEVGGSQTLLVNVRIVAATHRSGPPKVARRLL